MSDFKKLHINVSDALGKGFPKADIDELKEHFEATANLSDADRKTVVDQAFREFLFGQVITDIERIGPFIDFTILACRGDLATSSLPVVLLSDIFDVMTLDQCETIFTYVEDNVRVWREDWMFASCKNNLLRMCNDLLRRLSRSQNTVFCGRILLFLAMFFPFSERSGLNVVSEFNLENLTEFDADTAFETKDSNEAVPTEIDHTLYCKFWALQDFFRNPNQCYISAQWDKFAQCATDVLVAFKSIHLEEPAEEISTAEQMEVDEQIVREHQHFFAKFLTNPKLLALQLSDSNFRRSILVQFVILFQYLRSPVKFKSDNFSLTTEQNNFILDTLESINQLIKSTPPNGQQFLEAVQHMLEREEMWNTWKNDGCKEFRRPPIAAADPVATNAETTTTEPPVKQASKRPRNSERPLGDLIRDSIAQKRFYMGSSELTRLWNICPDNLQACRGEDRNFLPSIETYLENPKDKIDQSFEWRALRLLARQSPHFFSLTQTPNKVSDYLEGVRKKIHESKTKTASVANASATSNGHTMAATNASADANSAKADAASANAASATPVDGVDDEPTVESDINNTDDPISSGNCADDDDHNAHAVSIVTPEQMAQVAGIIAESWNKVAVKLGYTPDVVKFIDDKHPNAADKAMDMLRIWFDEDEDASLDNLAYMLEGIELVSAAEEIKRLIEPANKMDDVSE